jgi:uncharacterized membrane protein
MLRIGAALSATVIILSLGLSYLLVEARAGFPAALLSSAALVPALLSTGLAGALWLWYGRLRRGKLVWWSGLSGLAVLGLLSVEVGLALFQTEAYSRYRRCSAVVAAAVHAYQRRYGRLPAALADLGGEAATYGRWLHYAPDSGRRYFTLAYSPDGFHTVRYQSAGNQWLDN